MRVLVTNDDGVASRGLTVLARAVADAGFDVVVAAPDRDLSGASAAIGRIHRDEKIDATAVDLPGLDGVPCYAVDGPPGLCVLVARLGGLGEPPDLVISGINPGCNTGRAVLHSGTVGGALTAANFAVSGMAVSLDLSTLMADERPGGRVVPAADGQEAVAAVVGDAEAPAAGEPADRVDQRPLWEVPAAVAASLLDWLVAAPAGTVLNVNVPNRPLDQLAGVRIGRLAPFGTVRTGVVESADGGGNLQLELRPTETTLPEDTDSGLVQRGFVSLTPLSGITIHSGLDVAGALEAATIHEGRGAV